VSVKKRIYIALAVICLCTGIYFTSNHDNRPVTGYEKGESSYSISKTLHFGYTLQNTTSSVLSDVAFMLRLPLQQTPSQQATKLACSLPHRIIATPNGSHTLKIAFDTFPPFASKIVQLRVDMMMAEQPSASRESSLSKYLQAEKYIEVDSAEIQKAAAEISLGLQGRDAAVKIGRWVSDHIAVRTARRSRGLH